ncbi:MAG: Spo0E like sporulation regulatory protein [Paenibacillaceae bacterium]|nr:Spo0E like sporulation regulatory protein [Paenibacillaceae bacterium]
MAIACLKPEAEINQKIEFARDRMNRLADELGHHHPKVMICSQQLDELLLEFYALTCSMYRRTLSRSS